MVRLSRRKLALYAAEKLAKGEKKQHVIRELAAHLTDTGRQNEAELLVRDIEAALAERGIVVADVTSAHPLSEAMKKDIATLVGAKHIQFRETVDPAVLGGVRVSVPGQRFDGTVRRKLTLLKAKQL